MSIQTLTHKQTQTFYSQQPQTQNTMLISKLWCIQVMDNYSATKQENYSSCIHTTWMHLKIIIESERKQARRVMYRMIPFIQHSRKCKQIYRNRDQTVVAQGHGEGSQRGMKKLSRMMTVVMTSQVYRFIKTSDCTFYVQQYQLYLNKTAFKNN